MTTSNVVPVSRVSPAEFSALSPVERDEYLNGLLAMHRSVWGDARMEETGGDGGDGAPAGDGADGAPAGDGADGGDGAPAADAPKPGDPQASLTAALGTLDETTRTAVQAALDAIVGREKAKAKTAAEKAMQAQLEQAQADAGRSATEIAEARLADAQRALADARRENVSLLVQAAMTGVIAPNYMNLAVKAADLPEVGEDGTVDADAIKAAIAAVAEKYPAFKVEAAKPVDGVQQVAPVAGEPGGDAPKQPQSLADAIAAEMRKQS